MVNFSLLFSSQRCCCPEEPASSLQSLWTWLDPHLLHVQLPRPNQYCCLGNHLRPDVVFPRLPSDCPRAWGESSSHTALFVLGGQKASSLQSKWLFFVWRCSFELVFVRVVRVRSNSVTMLGFGNMFYYHFPEEHLVSTTVKAMLSRVESCDDGTDNHEPIPHLYSMWSNSVKSAQLSQFI